MSASVLLGILVAACGAAPAPSTADGGQGDALTACEAAVRAAGQVPAKKQRPEDLDVAIALCATSGNLAQAALLFPDALDGRDPFAVVTDRCRNQPSLAGAPMCRLLPRAAGSPGPVATLGLGEPGLGSIVFGKRLGAAGRSVDTPRTAFKRTTKRIAWAAWLTDLPQPGRSDLTLWRKGRDGEVMVWHRSLDIELDAGDHQGAALDLAAAADRQPGAYVVRYLVDGLPAAEGTFELVR